MANCCEQLREWVEERNSLFAGHTLALGHAVGILFAALPEESHQEALRQLTRSSHTCPPELDGTAYALDHGWHVVIDAVSRIAQGDSDYRLDGGISDL